MPTRRSDGAPQGADLGTHAVGRGGNHVMRGCGVQGCFSLEGLTMPSLHFRFIPKSPGALSIGIDHEGIFLYLWPFELALLWPGVQS